MWNNKYFLFFYTFLINEYFFLRLIQAYNS
ncbi:hypothetical protein P369_22945 [Comamonas thiooxydans]|nr:hypothetical protein P369_22945 [Comamonas thiooxydans]